MDFDAIRDLGLQPLRSKVIHNNPPFWNWRATIPDYYNLWIAYTGTGVMSLNGRDLAISPGLAILLFPGDRVFAEATSGSRMKNLALHFRVEPQAEGDAALSVFHGRPAHLSSLGFAHEIARRMDDGQASEAEATSWACHLFALFARDWELGPEDPRDRAIREQIERIREKPYGSLSVKDLASEAALSLSQYRRRFSRLAQSSPHAFFLQQRIESAQILLRESALTIDQIAQALGYRDTPFFSRQFKSKTGTTPSAFRDASRRGRADAATSQQPA